MLLCKRSILRSSNNYRGHRMMRPMHVATLVASLLALGWQSTGSEIAGMVRDIRGKPIANAYIEARHVEHAILDPADFVGEPALSTHTAQDGSWSLSGMGPGTW